MNTCCMSFHLFLLCSESKNPFRYTSNNTVIRRISSANLSPCISSQYTLIHIQPYKLLYTSQENFKRRNGKYIWWFELNGSERLLVELESLWHHNYGEWRECKVGMGLRKETSRMKIYSNCNCGVLMQHIIRTLYRPEDYLSNFGCVSFI